MEWPLRPWVALVVIVAITAGSHPSRAQQTGEKAALAEHLRTAMAAAKARQWETCIQAYEAAAALDPAPATFGELGLCEEQAGRFLDAYNHLHRATDAAPPSLAAGQETPWKRYEAAQGRARKRLVILFLTVSPTRATVLLDGRPLGRVEGRHIAVEPGAHVVSARLDGYEDAIEPPRTWSAGDIPHVHLELTPKTAPPGREVMNDPAKVPGPAVMAAPPLAPWYWPAATPRGVLVPLTWIGLATIAASGGTAIGLEVDRSSLQSRLPNDSACHPAAGGPPSLCSALEQRYAQRNAAVDVTIGATIATALLGGAAFVALALERRPSSPAITAVVGPDGGGISVRGAWPAW